jgi:hypothetical protein
MKASALDISAASRPGPTSVASRRLETARRTALDDHLSGAASG